jgi:hypothetical protein
MSPFIDKPAKKPWFLKFVAGRAPAMVWGADGHCDF